MGKKFIALLLGVAGVSSVAAQGYATGTTLAERVQLPKYCWPQYVDAKYGGQPGYSIPPSCGPRMNHLCQGHIFLIRAQRASDPPHVRKGNAGQAVSQFNYTLIDMPAACPLRGETEALLKRAKILAPDAK